MPSTSSVKTFMNIKRKFKLHEIREIFLTLHDIVSVSLTSFDYIKESSPGFSCSFLLKPLSNDLDEVCVFLLFKLIYLEKWTITTVVSAVIQNGITKSFRDVKLFFLQIYLFHISIFKFKASAT